MISAPRGYPLAGHFPGQHSPLFPANRAILVQKLPYRYRLYPHPHPQAALDRAFGYSPVVWNHALALGQHLYKPGENCLGGAGLQKRCLSQARQSPERSWLAEPSNVPLARSVRDLHKAFRAGWRGTPSG